VKNNKRKNWLRQDKSGPLDESRGPNPITTYTHHNHQITIKWLKKRKNTV